MKPVIAIVGRPNVGKSALFNRIARRQIALVYDRPGVTRDRISAECKWDGIKFTLVDTGGVGLDDESGFEAAIQREVEIAIGSSTDILLVVDGREGLQVLDREVAKRLRKVKDRRLYLVVNKIDSPKQDDFASDFASLGFDEVWSVSAAHGIGMDEMMSQIISKWPETADEDSPATQRATRVAVVGRPNVGKSSLINALIKEDRLIVSPVAGTTRDAVDISFTYHDRKYCFVDTAGMRKKSRVDDPLEQAMTGRTAHTINRSDICVLVLDATQGVGVQEKKIAGLIQEAGKPCVILINKWDLAAEVKKGGTNSPRVKGKSELGAFAIEYEAAVRRDLFFLPYSEVLFVSAMSQKQIGKWLASLEQIAQSRSTRISTGVLNRIIHRALQQKSSPRKNSAQFKIYYATQAPEETDVPTILAFVNDKSLLTPDYQRYLEQQLRVEYPCTGCPIRWVFKIRA